MIVFNVTSGFSSFYDVDNVFENGKAFAISSVAVMEREEIAEVDLLSLRNARSKHCVLNGHM